MKTICALFDPPRIINDDGLDDGLISLCPACAAASSPLPPVSPSRGAGVSARRPLPPPGGYLIFTWAAILAGSAIFCWMVFLAATQLWDWAVKP